jgi:hypothetical protein
VLLLAVFPRGAGPEDDKCKARDVITRVNEQIKKLDDGEERPLPRHRRTSSSTPRARSRRHHAGLPAPLEGRLRRWAKAIDGPVKE